MTLTKQKLKTTGLFAVVMALLVFAFAMPVSAAEPLSDGIYKAKIDMVKLNRASTSMADGAVYDTIKIEVVDGKYYATLDFKGLTIDGKLGYLAELYYYANGYTFSQYGAVQGDLVKGEVLSTQKNGDGSDVIDSYNNKNKLYPDLIKIQLVETALNDPDGYVALRVNVPIMESIEKDGGQQDVLMKIDWSSLEATTAADRDFLPGDLPFTDVDHWAYEYIRYVYANGIMNGLPGNLFKPDDALSRSQLATVLYRLDGSPEVKGSSAYSDVLAEDWFADAVIWASDRKIVKGMGNGKFAPNDNITREQIATMLYRYAYYKGYDVSDVDDLSAFSDASTVSDWANVAVKWAVSENLIKGRTATTLCPGDTASRAEIATILDRFMTNIVK